MRVVRVLGGVLTWAAVLWLAGAGLSSWSQRPPELLGLALGQVLVGVAVLMAVGLMLSRARTGT